MEYTKQTWTAPTGKGLSRYAKSGESASHVTLTLDPENLTNSPTPFTMARMAHMEDGIAKAYDTAPPTPWAQYSGKDIPQLPDNVAGTTYKRDNDWTTTDGWIQGHPTIVLSVENNALKIVYNGTRPDTGLSIQKNGLAYNNKFVVGKIKSTVPISSVHYYNGTVLARLKLTNTNSYETVFYGYMTSDYPQLVLYVNSGQLTAKTCWLESVYIGTGAYDRLVFDNSYHYRHLLNNAVVPTPQGLYFNGATSYLRSKEPVTLPDVFTFSATVNCAIKSTGQYFIGLDTGDFSLYINPNSSNLILAYYNTNTSGMVYINVFASLFTENTDFDLEFSCDFINKTIKVVKNGVMQNTITQPYLQKPTAQTNMFIGNAPSGYGPFLGYMRNICIYDTALTDTQRNWLAQGNIPPILYDVTNYELGNADTASKANVRVSLRHGNTWFEKIWGGKSDIAGDRIWTDGENIYYSYGTTQFILNKTTSTWVVKTWTGRTNFNGEDIWTDGENIYYSDGTRQHVLNKATSTWTAKTWGGLNSFRAEYIWTDGDNIYYSEAAQQFVLNKTTATWVAKTWTGLTNFDGKYIWTDGENIYYNNVTTQFVLNKVTSTWVVKTWKGLTDFHGENIWTDGENIYYSYTTQQFVLNKTTSTWVVKTWTGLPAFSSNTIWTDGDNIYYSSNTQQYVLPATRHNYVDDAKYNPLLGKTKKCVCSTLSDRFVFGNE